MLLPVLFFYNLKGLLLFMSSAIFSENPDNDSNSIQLIELLVILFKFSCIALISSIYALLRDETVGAGQTEEEVAITPSKFTMCGFCVFLIAPFGFIKV